MARLLIPVGSCSEAFELAPLVRACRDAGWQVDVAWFGTEAALAEARALGLPPPTRRLAPPLDQPAPVRHAAAVAFAADLLASGAPDAVLTCGHGTLALATGSVCHAEGLPVVRLGAGHRSHAPAERTERRRRAADHAASRWCVATDLQRGELLREGLPAEHVHVVGSLLPAALAALGEPAPVPPYVWLALEHPMHGAADGDALAALLSAVAAAAQSCALVVHAAAPGLAPALEQFGIHLPPGVELRANLGARRFDFQYN